MNAGATDGGTMRGDIKEDSDVNLDWTMDRMNCIASKMPSSGFSYSAATNTSRPTHIDRHPPHPP